MSVYDVKGDAAAREISCFLLAEQGKTFTIHWRDRGSGIASASYIELDGVTVPGKFLYGSGTSFRSGVRTGPESERPFSFAKVPDQNPSDAPLDYRYDLQKCGKIALWIKKVTLREHCGANSIVDAIPEPMKGKGRHFPLAVGYEAARPTGYQHELTRTFEPFDNTNPGPEVTFVWRYRDLEWMIINGHNIPGRMLPPPEPSSAHRKKAKGKEKERASRDGDTPSPTVGAKRDRVR
ncbi:uncharacterized protein STEHIDRAFT_119354 [Stereum hirsutum FP-91666 SS1]|uniref:uncharacterized protein n=1 Tax=Stereum hirsutum (strain FP-91666) TaxID=721885 RepID=UPI000440D689|nr:uncharacterized protein STEHIDRAFT_119354 [Stereum hirsutum FP-91666 SS1]EIM90332.1 hypothetical protein STEHIDRAFT_119354 [Stereum hirsutum FP-91666 SS1]